MKASDKIKNTPKISAKAYLAASAGGVVSGYSYISTLKKYKSDMEFEAQKIFARQKKRSGKVNESDCYKSLLNNPTRDATKNGLANTLTVGMASNAAMIAGIVIVSVITGPLLPIIAILGTIGAAFAGLVTGHFLSPKIAEKSLNTELKDIISKEDNKNGKGLESSVKAKAAEREMLIKSLTYKETKQDKEAAKAESKPAETEKTRPPFLQKIFDEKAAGKEAAKPNIKIA